jgi:RNA polymerase sigma-70 factor (ECF subfamily)
MQRFSDAALLARAAAGDEAAFGELHRRHVSWACNYARRLLGGQSSTSGDAVQEAFIDLWRSADHYDAGRGPLRPWLATLVRNRVIDGLRRRRYVQVDLEAIAELPSADDAADVIAHRAITARCLAAAIEDLPEAQRQAVRLSYFDGLSHSEIAEHVGVALGTVKGRLRLAMGKLSSAELQASIG